MTKVGKGECKMWAADGVRTPSNWFGPVGGEGRVSYVSVDCCGALPAEIKLDARR